MPSNKRKPRDRSKPRAFIKGSPKQSSFARIRELTKNTRFAQEQRARSSSSSQTKRSSSPITDTSPTRANAKRLQSSSGVKGTDITSAAIQNIVSGGQPAASSSDPFAGNPTAPTLANARKLQNAIREERDYQTEVAKLDKPGGWKNVVDVYKIALNPFSRDRIVADVQNETLRKTLEAGSNNPYTTAALATGVVGLIRGVGASLSALTGKTAVKEGAKVGVKSSAKATSTAGSMATNSATRKATTSMLTKMAKATTNPKFVVGGIMAMIGSYPFAGFIKEESLQTLSFGVRSAVDNNDPDGAQEAIDMQKEILDPGVWDRIFQSVPFANVLANLQDFYKAARIKTSIDERVVTALRNKLETGQSDTDMWEQTRQEQDEMERGQIDYFNEQRLITERRIADLKAQAQAEADAERRAQILEQIRLWEQYAVRKAEQERKEREETAAFWLAYNRELQNIQSNAPSGSGRSGHEESSFSTLNFGLL